MELLYLLENIRLPALNQIMLGVTHLGAEIAFLVVAMILVWCVDKRTGYYVMAVGFLGTITNQFMKLWFRIPRPWVYDESFTIVEQAREGASGYSFPSGHTQSAVGTFGALAYTTKRKVIRVVSVVIAILVPISRMYLGVHTPLDVSVAAVIALALVFVLKPVVLGKNKWVFPCFLGIMVVVACAYLCFVELYPFPADTDPHNMESGLKNAYTLLGTILGLIVVYILDETWLHFPTKAVWWAQVLKVTIGLALVLVVKTCLRIPCNAIFGIMVGRSVRYFLMVIVGGVLWPTTFKWFSGLGRKE